MNISKTLLLTAIVIVGTTSQPDKSEKADKAEKVEKPVTQLQCTLALRIFPLKYIDASRTMSLRVRFESNCMPYYQPMYLELPWSRDFDLTADNHPREALLNIFDRELTLSFSKPVKLTLRRKLYIDYHTVRVSPSNYSTPVNVALLNFFTVKDKEGDIFIEKENLDKLWSVDYPFLCGVQSNKQFFVCDIKNIGKDKAV